MRPSVHCGITFVSNEPSLHLIAPPPRYVHKECTVCISFIKSKTNVKEYEASEEKVSIQNKILKLVNKISVVEKKVSLFVTCAIIKYSLTNKTLISHNNCNQQQYICFI